MEATYAHRIREQFTRNRAEMHHVLWLGLLAAALFAPVTINTALNFNDVPYHTDWVAQMWASKTLLLPHFLYHLLVILVHPIVSLSVSAFVPRYADQTYLIAGIIVIILAHALLACVLYVLLRSILDQARRSAVVLCGACALGLMLVWPITLFFPFDQHAYFGYIGLNTYHNPTQVLLKPLGLLLFLYAMSVFTFEDHRPWHRIGIVAVLVVASTLVKPTYIICLLPALGAYAIYAFVRRQRVNWLLLIVGVAVPALAVLAWQYLFTYIFDTMPSGEGEIILAPFAFYEAHDAADFLGFKVVLSLLFPLSVAILYFKQAFANITLRLAWLVTGVGLFYGYLLAEQGPRLAHGNFLWAGQMAGLILFVTSLLFLIEQNRDIFDRWLGQKQAPPWNYSLLICLAVFVLHVANGVLWYGSQLLLSDLYQAW